MHYTVETKINNLNYIDDKNNGDVLGFFDNQHSEPTTLYSNLTTLGSLQDASYETNISIYSIKDKLLYKLTINSTYFEMLDVLQSMFQNFDGRIINADFSYAIFQDGLEKNRKDYANPPQSTKVFDPIVKTNYGVTTNMYGEFINTDFSSAIFKDIIIKNVAFYNCVFTNADFYNVTFENCIFDNCSFIQANFNYVSFYNSSFSKDCEFLSSVWNNCVFDLYRSLNGDEAYVGTLLKSILLYSIKNNYFNHWDKVNITACDFHYPKIDENGNIVFDSMSLDDYIETYVKKDI